MPASRALPKHAVASERPDELALDGVIVGAAGELAEIAEAERDVRCDPQVDSGLEQRAVGGDGRADDRERHAARNESERGLRRDVVEGVLPGGRNARRQDHGVVERNQGGKARAERGVAGLLGGAGAGQRGASPVGSQNTA